jgi:hypothetical protein
MFLPLPVQRTPDRTYTEDDVKWSLYAKKTFAGVFSIRAQVARDHMRPVFTARKKQDKEEAIQKQTHWYYMLKIQYDL